MTDLEFTVKPFHYGASTRIKIQELRNEFKDIMALEGYHKYRVIEVALAREIRCGNVHSKAHLMQKLDTINKQALEYGSY